MLDVGGFSTRTCHGHSRRAFLRTASSLPLTWGLSPAFSTGAINPGKAKSILLVWLWGGPSHLDMFDPIWTGLILFRTNIAISLLQKLKWLQQYNNNDKHKIKRRLPT